MLVRWMETNQSNANKQRAKQKTTGYNFQFEHIFTFILDVKLFTVSTGIAPNDGKLYNSFCIDDGTEAVCECLVVVNDCLVKLFVDRK